MLCYCLLLFMKIPDVYSQGKPGAPQPTPRLCRLLILYLSILPIDVCVYMYVYLCIVLYTLHYYYCMYYTTVPHPTTMPYLPSTYIVCMCMYCMLSLMYYVYIIVCDVLFVVCVVVSLSLRVSLSVCPWLVGCVATACACRTCFSLYTQ